MALGDGRRLHISSKKKRPLPCAGGSWQRAGLNRAPGLLGTMKLWQGELHSQLSHLAHQAAARPTLASSSGFPANATLATDRASRSQ